MGEELQLWERIVQRDPIAFELLFKKYHSRLSRFARIYVSASGAADDVTQECFLELWKRPYGFDPARGSLEQYLFGIARRQAAQLRRRGRSRDPQASTTLLTEGNEDAISIKDAFEQLDIDDQTLLWLREVEGYAYSELARILDRPIGTIKSQLFSARENLRRVWLHRR
jgi:RNA polymerase sigma-70 factor (ECF subfamily)